MKPAIKKPSGKVVSKHLPAHHKDIAKKDKEQGGDGKGRRGFVDDDKFIGRQEAKEVAGIKIKGKRGLHSQDLIKEKKK